VSQRGRLVPVAIAAALAAIACGGASPRRAPPRPTPPLDRVERLLPPGAEWVVIARPADLWATAAVRRSLEPVIRERDIAAYAARTGIHLTNLSELAAGSYGDRGTLVAIRGPEASKSIRQTLALAETAPFAFRPVRPDVALVASGPGAAALLEEAGRLGARPPRDLPADLASLRQEAHDAPLQLLVATPLEVDRTTPAAVLLSGVRHAAAGATPRGAEIAFRVALLGDFPPTAADNFRRLLVSIADATLGEIFGLAEVAESARIEATSTRVEIDSAIAAASVASGIETLFIAKLRELLGEPPTGENP